MRNIWSLPIDEEWTRPHFLLVFPNGSVIEKTHCQVIFNEIFSWNSQIERIPVKERFSEDFALVFGNNNFIRVISSEENVVPKFSIELRCLYSQCSSSRSNYISLEEVNNCVISHIDCRIWEWFNQVIVVKREVSSQSKRARASPLVEPFYSSNEHLMDNVVVAIEGCAKMSLYLCLPVLQVVSNVPLITQGDNAFVSSPRNNFAFRLPVFCSLSACKEVISNKILSFLDFSASIFSYSHDSIIKSFKIAFILC